MGDGPKNGVNLPVGLVRPPCRLSDGLLPNHHSKLCIEISYGKIFENLINSKNMVFNVKKLLYDGMDLLI
jgi:hypothetical protein